MLRQPDLLSEAGQTLTLRQLAPADAGQYVCEASNSAGTATKRFSLSVAGELDGVVSQLGAAGIEAVHVGLRRYISGEYFVIYLTTLSLWGPVCVD